MSSKRPWLIVVLLALLAPAGLWISERLGAGEAWGEWAPEQVGERVGFIPRQLARLARLWHAPVPDYAPPGWEGRSLAYRGLAYLGSALLGIAVSALVIWALGRWLARRDTNHAT